MADPLVIQVAALRRVVGSSAHYDLVGPFDPTGEYAPSALVDTHVPEGGELSISVDLASFSGGIMAVGTASVPYLGVCRRCATVIDGELTVQFRERFLEESHRTREEDPDDSYPISDEMIDLGKVGRDAVILDMPLVPLCKEDCKGLCSICGIDRNVESCDCAAPKDPRWATLDLLSGGDTTDID